MFEYFRRIFKKEAEFIEKFRFLHIMRHKYRQKTIKHFDTNVFLKFYFHRCQKFTFKKRPNLSFSAAEVFGQAGRKILMRVGNTARYKEGWGGGGVDWSGKHQAAHA
jgi:hypothetical protein